MGLFQASSSIWFSGLDSNILMIVMLRLDCTSPLLSKRRTKNNWRTWAARPTGCKTTPPPPRSSRPGIHPRPGDDPCHRCPQGDLRILAVRPGALHAQRGAPPDNARNCQNFVKILISKPLTNFSIQYYTYYIAYFKYFSISTRLCKVLIFCPQNLQNLQHFSE